MTAFHALPRRPRAVVAALATAAAAVALLGVIGVGVIGAHGGTATAAVPAASSPHIAANCSRAVAPGHAACFAVHVTGAAPAQRRGSGDVYYTPAQLRSAYQLPSTTAGKGQRVFVIDAYDDPRAAQDLAVYRHHFGMRACTVANGCFRKINQYGSAARSTLPRADRGWSGEISLDLDMVSAVCPNCAITLVEARNDTIGALMSAVHRATARGARFVSMSWGGPDVRDSRAIDARYLRRTGVVYTAAAGDSGYQGASYPASSPLVTAVGGTSLRRTSAGWSDSVWHVASRRRPEGTGSGCSRYEPKPAWQSFLPNSVCAGRAETDVAVDADPSTGVLVYQRYGGYGWSVYGGTSAGAPIVAAAWALAGRPASTSHPSSFPYAHPTALRDVTTGYNGSCSITRLCHAGAGWDGPTGLGSPVGVGAFLPPGVTPAHRR